jgi:hypothetical protein
MTCNFVDPSQPPSSQNYGAVAFRMPEVLLFFKNPESLGGEKCGREEIFSEICQPVFFMSA